MLSVLQKILIALLEFIPHPEAPPSNLWAGKKRRPGSTRRNNYAVPMESIAIAHGTEPEEFIACWRAVNVAAPEDQRNE
jgi:hypothetical protein